MKKEKKKTRLLDISGIRPTVLLYGPRPSAPSPRPLCSASNHDTSGKSKHAASFTSSLLL